MSTTLLTFHHRTYPLHDRLAHPAAAQRHHRSCACRRCHASCCRMLLLDPARPFCIQSTICPPWPMASPIRSTLMPAMRGRFTATTFLVWRGKSRCPPFKVAVLLRLEVVLPSREFQTNCRALQMHFPCAGESCIKTSSRINGFPPRWSAAQLPPSELSHASKSCRQAARLSLLGILAAASDL